MHGTPADCVLVGLFDILDTMPDLVLSGVNKGNNAGQNTLYSGTLGASLEAAMHGLPAIALSQFFGPKLDGHDTFDAARAHGLSTVQMLLDRAIWSNGQSRIHYNINFPPCLSKDVKGHAGTQQGFRAGSPFHAERIDGDLWIKGKPQHEDTGAGTDIHANINNQISITPCTVDMTDHTILKKLRQS